MRRTRLSTYGDRAFPVAASRVWNSLPHHVTSAQSLPVFRSCLKTHLFRRCFPWLYCRAREVTLVNRCFYLLRSTYLLTLYCYHKARTWPTENSDVWNVMLAYVTDHVIILKQIVNERVKWTYWPTNTVMIRAMRLVGVSATHVYWPLSLGLTQSRYSRDFVRLRVTDAGFESNVSSSTQLTLLPCTASPYKLRHCISLCCYRTRGPCMYLTVKTWQLQTHCNLRPPKPRQSFSALITTPCQDWSHWIYPLPYCSVSADYFMLWPWPLTLWPLTLNISRVLPVMWWNSIPNLNAAEL